MTKTQFGQSDNLVKPTHQSPGPEYTQVQVADGNHVSEQVDHSGATCWYVFGILSTIFCCLPCGVIGMVHAMIAKHEGEKGNLPGHRRRLRQAKCWTCWSILLGLMVVLAMVAYVAVRYGLLSGICGVTDEWNGSRNYTDDYNQFNTSVTPEIMA